MTQSQGASVPRCCPRCGGLMVKPAGSPLYWHVDNNHPRCNITNIVDPPVAVQPTEEPPQNEPPKGKRSRK